MENLNHFGKMISCKTAKTSSIFEKDMEKKLYKKRVKTLKKSKASLPRLSILEILTMKVNGRNDAKNNLIYVEDGITKSIRLQQLTDSFNEFNERLYGLLKLEEEYLYKKLNALISELNNLKAKYQSINLELDQTKTDQVFSKVGEENLDIDIITARRNRELSKKCQHLQSERNLVEQEIHATRRSIVIITSCIEEDFLTTTKISTRFKERVKRRVDIYWHAALKQNNDLPSLPVIDFSNKPQESYESYMLEKIKKIKQEVLNNV